MESPTDPAVSGLADTTVATEPDKKLLPPAPAPRTPRTSPQLVPYHWKPGQSGNIAGRGPTLTGLIRKETKEGHELVAFWLKVLRDQRAPRRDRLECASQLADRGFGKPPQYVAHAGVDGGPIPIAVTVSQMTDAELVAFIRRGMRSIVVEGATVTGDGVLGEGVEGASTEGEAPCR